MRRLLRAAALGAALSTAAAAVTSCRTQPAGQAAQPRPARAARYYCPMHPSYTSERPGSCPICGMALVPLETPAAAGAPAAAPAQGVAGRAAVTLSGERRQMLGVRSEPVRRGVLTRTIRTVGRIAVDERRVHHVHTKLEGYVEHLYVDFTGKHVRKGEPLVSLFSPELVATQQEYLLAYRAQQQLAASGLPQVAQGGVDLLEAARQRLLLWDIQPRDIETLERTGRARRTLDLYAALDGYVVQKMAVHGARVMPADALFDIADLSRLWVLADVYESDLPLVRPGMDAELSVPYLPGRRWRGPVAYVDPMVSDKTRTVKVRIEVRNQDEALKPEMFADVLLHSGLGDGLSVPDSAVIHSGDRQIVFLDRGEGRYEPRPVELGPRVGDGFQVLGGLAEGDRVVISASFLLDSESSLKAALAEQGAAAAGAPPAAGHRH